LNLESWIQDSAGDADDAKKHEKNLQKLKKLFPAELCLALGMVA
jgi:hypothetical protein